MYHRLPQRSRLSENRSEEMMKQRDASLGLSSTEPLTHFRKRSQTNPLVSIRRKRLNEGGVWPGAHERPSLRKPER